MRVVTWLREPADAAPVAVVIAESDGTVVSQDESARRMMGPGVGRPCWEVVGGLAAAEGLACSPGCAAQLSQCGAGALRHTRLALHGQRRELTCVPVRDAVVCVLGGAPPAAVRSRPELTRREVEVLRLLAEGRTTRAIAGRLHLSEATVRTHVEHMRTKLNAPTRARIVALAFRLGLLD